MSGGGPQLCDLGLGALQLSSQNAQVLHIRPADTAGSIFSYRNRARNFCKQLHLRGRSTFRLKLTGRAGHALVADRFTPWVDTTAPTVRTGILPR